MLLSLSSSAGLLFQRAPWIVKSKKDPQTSIYPAQARNGLCLESFAVVRLFAVGCGVEGSRLCV